MGERCGLLKAFPAFLVGGTVAVVFFRQLLWLVPHPWIAWSLSSIGAVAALTGYARVYRTTRREVSLQWRWFFFIALPVTILFFARAALPDLNPDTWDFRLLSSERALAGAPNHTSDFFFRLHNPLPDMVLGLFRHALGFRLGVIVNLLVVVWCGLILEKFLRRFVASPGARALVVISALITEGVLFELSTYYVDLLPLPFLLEATFIAFVPGTRRDRDLLLISLLCGVACALKLSSALFVPGIFLLAYFQAVPELGKKHLLRIFLAFGFPLLSHVAFYAWGKRTSGNLLTGLASYPLRYLPLSNGGGDIMPERDALEILFWPIISFFHPEEASHLSHSSGRLAVVFIIGAASLAFAKVRWLAAALLLGTVLWSSISGYLRFAVYLEIVAPLLVVMVAGYLPTGRKRTTAVLAVFLLLQVTSSLTFFDHIDWRDRPAAWRAPRRHLREAASFLNDYSFQKYLTERLLEATSTVDLWIEVAHRTSAISVLTRKKPIVSILNDAISSLDLVELDPTAATKNLAAFIPESDFSEAAGHLLSRGFKVIDIQRFHVPSFSRESRVPNVLVRLAIFDAIGPHPPQQSMTVPAHPLMPEQMHVQMWFTEYYSCLRPSQQATYLLSVRNAGKTPWPGGQNEDALSSLQLELVSRWKVADAGLPYLDASTPLLTDIPPEGIRAIPITTVAPPEEGTFKLNFAIAQAGNATFPQPAESTLQMEVKVSNACSPAAGALRKHVEAETIPTRS